MSEPFLSLPEPAITTRTTPFHSAAAGGAKKIHNFLSDAAVLVSGHRHPASAAPFGSIRVQRLNLAGASCCLLYSSNSCCCYRRVLGMAAGSRWSFARNCVAGLLIGVTIRDRYGFLSPVTGPSMEPTFESRAGYVLAERFCLHSFNFSRGDIVIFTSPTEHRKTVVKRVIGLPGDWIQVPEAGDIRQVPEGHCWVEGDNAAVSFDSRSYGPVPLGLMKGRVTHVVWPPSKIGRVDRKMPEGRVMPR